MFKNELFVSQATAKLAGIADCQKYISLRHICVQNSSNTHPFNAVD
jgi:hypothetical protein